MEAAAEKEHVGWGLPPLDAGGKVEAKEEQEEAKEEANNKAATSQQRFRFSFIYGIR